jgi:hypothetical protein
LQCSRYFYLEPVGIYSGHYENHSFYGRRAMNVSWGDVNNVQEAGDYPFRDGTIAITFAELLIWKAKPDSHFQLMRKHPIQDVPRYVLGHEIEENPTPVERTSAGEAATLIAYDLHASKGTQYDELVEKIMSLGAWWHHLETVWIVKSVHAPGQIRDQLAPYIGSDDQLLVVDITGDMAEAVGLNSAGTQWLQETLSRTTVH